MIPLSRLRSRLGLDPYNKSAPVLEQEVKTNRLNIYLNQHIGAPAVPVVKKGDKVLAGQKVAAPKENALSVAIHSAFSGTVAEVTDRKITINI